MADHRTFISGWRPSPPDQRDRVYSLPGRAVQSLPRKADLRTAAVSIPPLEPNWDQGNLGSCGPHAVGANIAYDLLADGLPPRMPSRLFIYYFTRLLMGTVGYDSGVNNRAMMKALVQYGWCDEALWPYRINDYRNKPSQAAIDQAATRKGGEYLAVRQDLLQMKACLAGDPAGGIPGRPFVFGFTVYESFMSDEVAATGRVPMPRMTEAVLGGHDVLIDGFDDDAQVFLFDNSWGEGWGQGGRGTMPYAYASSANLSGDFWTARGTGGAPPPPPEPPPAPPSPPPLGWTKVITVRGRGDEPTVDVK